MHIFAKPAAMHMCSCEELLMHMCFMPFIILWQPMAATPLI
jgi:hypothetical protein